ncbi:MAG: nucleotidyltransferase family protein [Bacteroidales bacterium]|nr:nucleotidyltransferase family protein [Bacteroidales bacterium]
MLLFDLLYRALGPNRNAAMGEEIAAMGNPDAATWRKTAELGELGEVSGLLYDAILTLPPHQQPDKELLLRWAARVQSIERDNCLFRQRFIEAISQLEAHGLEPILFKGLTLSELYPNPLHRPVGDIDLFVPLDMQHRYLQCLGDKDAGSHQDFDAKHIAVEYNGLNWELHFRSIFFYSRITDRRYHLLELEETGTDSLFHFDIEGHRVQVFPPRLHMVYLTAHFQHHLLVERVTLRQVVDWMLALHRDRTALAIQEVLFIRTLQQLCLYRLYCAIGYIATHYMGFNASGYAGLSNLTPADARRGELLLQVLLAGHVPGCPPHYALQPSDGFMTRVQHFYHLCKRCYVLFSLGRREALSAPFGYLRYAMKRRFR